MLRFILILLAAILLISLLRSIIGIVVKGFAQALSSNDGNAAMRGGGPPASELKKDPVCGAYVPTATSVKKMVGGGVVYFCSTTCRDKYQG
jgi:YHS domain-containing protein